jgi:hypothetical protein
MDRRKRTRVLFAVGVVLALFAGIEYFVLHYKPRVKSNVVTTPLEIVATRKSDVPVPLEASSTQPVETAKGIPTYTPAGQALPSQETSDDKPLGSIEGLVVSQTKTSFANWEVIAKATGPGKHKGRHAAVAANGKYSLRDLYEGEYQLQALPSPDGSSFFMPIADAVTVALAKDEHRTGIVLSVEIGSSISGIVLNSDGQPIGQASVNAFQPGGGPDPGFSRASTDRLGRFEVLGLTAGSCRLTVSCEGYQSIGATVEPGRRDLQFVLEPSVVSIRGRVIDARTGSPIQSFDLVVRSGEIVDEDRFRLEQPLHIENAEGRFETKAEHLAGTVSLQARAARYSPASTSVSELMAGDTADVELRLEPSLSLRGRVIDEKGNAVPGAFVSIGMPILTYGQNWERVADAQTDDEGRFSLESIPQGATVVSAWMGPRTSKVPGTAAIPAPGPNGIVEVEIQMPESGARLVVSVKMNQEPVVGAYVHARFDPSPFSNDFSRAVGSTNEDGMWEVDGLPEGEATLDVAMLGFRDENYGEFEGSMPRIVRTVHLVHGQECRQEVDFNFGSAYIHGQIGYSGPVPMGSGIGIVMWDSPDGDQFYMTQSLNAAGEFFLGGFPAGTAALRLILNNGPQTLVDEKYTIELVTGQITTFRKEY